MKNRIQVSYETHVSFIREGQRYQGGMQVKSRNVRAALSLLRHGKPDRIISLHFCDEVHATMPYGYKGVCLELSAFETVKKSRMEYFVGDKIQVLTRRKVAEKVPALAKRMRELKYPYAIRVGGFNYVCCKDYRVYKGYVGLVDAARIDYPPYSIWSVL